MTIDYTAHLRSDGELMARAVARDLEAHVPSCPAWNVAKLTIHTGQHHRWVADAVRKGGEEPVDPPKPGLRGDALVQWFREGWSDLAGLLDTTADDARSWSWSGDNRAGFWRRRTTLETLVHRWDAENATGEATPLDPELAADGVDEILFVFVVQDGDTVYRGVPLQVTVTTTDTRSAWTLDLEDGATPRPARGDGAGSPEGSVGVSGTAEDLLLFLWGRRGPESVAFRGADEHVAALLSWLRE
ncbi:MAG TPA: maleylpyruvate isomerase family mycothiol-dependent enzyme [Actinomycetota bacterium]|nr:maleylpyruvate isomerase family mycothiol-dependent enzyme [Actinomycetota bacterium]